MELTNEWVFSEALAHDALAKKGIEGHAMADAVGITADHLQSFMDDDGLLRFDLCSGIESHAFHELEHIVQQVVDTTARIGARLQDLPMPRAFSIVTDSEFDADETMDPILSHHEAVLPSANDFFTNTVLCLSACVIVLATEWYF